MQLPYGFVSERHLEADLGDDDAGYFNSGDDGKGDDAGGDDNSSFDNNGLANVFDEAMVDDGIGDIMEDDGNGDSGDLDDPPMWDGGFFDSSQNSPLTPQQTGLIPKKNIGSIRSNGGYMVDPLGTGEILNDETSVAALLALFGLLAVILVAAYLVCVFRQFMDTIPNVKKGAAKQSSYKVTSSPLVTKRDRGE